MPVMMFPWNNPYNPYNQNQQNNIFINPQQPIAGDSNVFVPNYIQALKENTSLQAKEAQERLSPTIGRQYFPIFVRKDVINSPSQQVKTGISPSIQDLQKDVQDPTSWVNRADAGSVFMPKDIQQQLQTRGFLYNTSTPDLRLKEEEARRQMAQAQAQDIQQQSLIKQYQDYYNQELSKNQEQYQNYYNQYNKSLQDWATAYANFYKQQNQTPSSMPVSTQYNPPIQQRQQLQAGMQFDPVNHFERVADDRIQQTTLDGRQVYAFTVRPGDVQSWDRGNIGPGGYPNQRAEISYAPGADSAKPGAPYNIYSNTGVRTYHTSYNFASGFPTYQRWATLLQFHPLGTTGWGFSGITIHGNRIEFMTPFTGHSFASIPIQTGQWYDFQTKVNWSPNSDGYVYAYLNGQLIGQYHGPTTVNGQQYYMKQGYYRDGSTQQVGTVYQTPVGIT